MILKKTVIYKPINVLGKNIGSKEEINLKVSEKSGNYLIHREILRYSNSQNQGTSSTKTRSEVRGGGKKPWKQKGTGRARAGSNCSPLWKGGGIAFGPKPKYVYLKSNKKEKKLTIQTLFYNKRNSVLIIENLENYLTVPSTKGIVKMCENCNIDLSQKVLMVVSKKTKVLKLATHNIKNIELIASSHLNTLSLLKANYIILTPLSVNDIKKNFYD